MNHVGTATHIPPRANVQPIPNTKEFRRAEALGVLRCKLAKLALAQARRLPAS